MPALRIYQAEGGTTEPPPGIYQHEGGDSISVTAFPNEGYEFDRFGFTIDYQTSEYTYNNPWVFAWQPGFGLIVCQPKFKLKGVIPGYSEPSQPVPPTKEEEKEIEEIKEDWIDYGLLATAMILTYAILSSVEGGGVFSILISLGVLKAI